MTVVATKVVRRERVIVARMTGKRKITGPRTGIIARRDEKMAVVRLKLTLKIIRVRRTMVPRMRPRVI